MIIKRTQLSPDAQHSPQFLTFVYGEQGGPNRIGVQSLCYIEADGVNMYHDQTRGKWTIEAKRP